MNELSVRQILKNILTNNTNLLNSRDELINLLKQKTPGELARELNIVQKALQCNIGEYFLKAQSTQRPSDKIDTINKVKEILKQENLQDSSIEKVTNTFIYALGWANMPKNQSPRVEKQPHFDKPIETFDISTFNKELAQLKNQINTLERNYQLILSYIKTNEESIERLRKNIELFLNNSNVIYKSSLTSNDKKNN